MSVKFHVPDFARLYGLNLGIVSMIKNCPDYFREDVEIASVFGTFPQSLWNGGRTTGGKCDIDFVKHVLKAFNSQGIPLRYTFTNPLIEEKHLDDEFCNTVMKLSDNGLNEAIVNSPILEDYIRDKYPNFKVTSSTCKRITELEKLSDELDKDYHLVVVDYDFNNKFDLLERIPKKEKCEILINPVCNPGCKIRVEHYKKIGRQQIEFCEHIKNHPDEPFDLEASAQRAAVGCGCGTRSFFDVIELENNVKPDDIWNKYLPMGFEHFKIEGRTAHLLNMVETYIYYMAKPEFRDKARYLLLYNLDRNGFIKMRQ